MDSIVFGDCRDIMRQWAKDGIKVQTCVTSPPYYGLRDYGHDGQIGLEQTPAEYVKAMVEVFECVWDVLEDDGTLWLNLGDSYYNYRPGKGQAMNKQTVSKTNQDLPTTNARRGNKLAGLKEKDLIGIPWRVAFALQDAGWYLRQDIIWHKPNPMPESVKDRCTKAHEYIFLFSKKPQYYFDNEAIKEPAIYGLNSKEKRPPGIVRDRLYGYDSKEAELRGRVVTQTANGVTIRHPNGKHGDKQQSPKTLVDMRNKRDVWVVTTKPYKGAHFATFPPPLIEPCILAGSRVNDIVLDPFMGSGTTAMVAKQHGRRYLGCELNEDYRELQDKRLGIETKKDLFNDAIT
jgi:DNA modification methylase